MKLILIGYFLFFFFYCISNSIFFFVLFEYVYKWIEKDVYVLKV